MLASAPAFGVDGLGFTVKTGTVAKALFPLAVAVETDTSPEVAVAGKFTVTEVAVVAVGTAVMPLNETELTAVIFVPVIVTTVATPAQADVGVKLVIVGTVTQDKLTSQPAGVTEKSDVNRNVNSPPGAVEKKVWPATI